MKGATHLYNLHIAYEQPKTITKELAAKLKFRDDAKQLEHTQKILSVFTN